MTSVPEATFAPVFAALGDDTRWTILTRLGRGAASASSLARELPVTRQAIGKHLDVLRTVGLVEADQRGREVVYRALGARLSDVARGLDEIATGWERQLSELKRVAEQDASD